MTVYIVLTGIFDCREDISITGVYSHKETAEKTARYVELIEGWIIDTEGRDTLPYARQTAEAKIFPHGWAYIMKCGNF